MASRFRDRSERRPRASGTSSRLTRRDFERLVEQALDDLPEQFAAALDNVAVVVEDEPAPDVLADFGFVRGGQLCGLCYGGPLPEGDSFYQALPDRISIYRGPLERVCRSRREIVGEIRDTVVHELGHYFGLSDEEMPY